MVGVASVFLLVWALWRVFFPPVFDLILRSGEIDEDWSATLDYRFLNELVAADFAELNPIPV